MSAWAMSLVAVEAPHIGDTADTGGSFVTFWQNRIIGTPVYARKCLACRGFGPVPSDTRVNLRLSETGWKGATSF
jgi:hypothetical protein